MWLKLFTKYPTNKKMVPYQHENRAPDLSIEIAILQVTMK